MYNHIQVQFKKQTVHSTQFLPYFIEGVYYDFIINYDDEYLFCQEENISNYQFCPFFDSFAHYSKLILSQGASFSHAHVCWEYANDNELNTNFLQVGVDYAGLEIVARIQQIMTCSLWLARSELFKDLHVENYYCLSK